MKQNFYFVINYPKNNKELNKDFLVLKKEVNISKKNDRIKKKSTS